MANEENTIKALGEQMSKTETASIEEAYIDRLKKEKDVVILAHYYVDGEVQRIADYVGDSYYLSKAATKVPQGTILFFPLWERQKKSLTRKKEWLWQMTVRIVRWRI